ncbi:MAG: sugar phosphate isomerase/epimerase [Planctomycetota bacterium]|nr:MAG: sugar phosphate isomerase/epimerase [Planctomycetota bacterium]REJ94105.1 MAG: sugar phosphate isomerase/epimerase [Planctomycetota bacterium]
MIQLRIGIQTASLQLPLKRALHVAAQLGAEAVEIDARHELPAAEFGDTALRQVRKLLTDLELRVAALGFPTRRGFDVADDLERRVAATKQAMTMAYKLGAAVVVNQVGPVPSADAEQRSPTDERRFRQLVEVLTDLGIYGQRHGALLAAETGTESGTDLAALLAEVPAGSVGATLDPGNLIVGRFSPLEAIEALGTSILHVHAKDAALDLAQHRGVEVPLGRGSADFPAILAALEERDYRGYLVIERQGGENPRFEIAQAVKYLRSL